MTTAPEPFDQGGALPSGVTLMTNETGAPVQVLTAEQWHNIAGGES